MSTRFTQVKHYFQRLKQLRIKPRNYRQVVYKILAFCLLIYVFYSGISHLFRYNEYVQRHRDMENQLNTEKAKQGAWLDHLSRLESDAYWEWMARRKFGMIQEDEQIYKIKVKADQPK